MGWWGRVNDVLKKEPETWLAYLYGQRFQDLKHLQDAEPRYQGAVLRFLIYIYTLLRQIRFRFSPRIEPTTFLVYAGTLNQLSALQSTVTSLREKGQSIVMVVPKSLIDRTSCKFGGCQTISLGVFDLFRVLLLTSRRIIAVLRSLNELSPDFTRKRMDVIFRPHIDLIYFDRLLSYAKPKCVIVSNDHNIPNRALLALARNRGCKTVYMQHASVSALFPALSVDYAFLDGKSAYETYLQCEGNQPASDPRLVNRQVILSGQKKTLSRRVISLKPEVAGFAVNSLDNLTDISAFVKQISEHEVSLKVRWHPALSSKIIDNLKSVLAPYQVQYSDPRTEHVSVFLNSIGALIAGNSSIHLESALCGVPTFYYEISETDKPDYYGYVKHGLAIHAVDMQQLVELLDEALKGELQVSVDAVRYYSSTYETEWEGREGELVASTLVAIEAGAGLPVDVQAFRLE